MDPKALEEIAAIVAKHGGTVTWDPKGAKPEDPPKPPPTFAELRKSLDEARPMLRQIGLFNHSAVVRHMELVDALIDRLAEDVEALKKQLAPPAPETVA